MQVESKIEDSNVTTSFEPVDSGECNVTYTIYYYGVPLNKTGNITDNKNETTSNTTTTVTPLTPQPRQNTTSNATNSSNKNTTNPTTVPNKASTTRPVTTNLTTTHPSNSNQTNTNSSTTNSTENIAFLSSDDSMDLQNLIVLKRFELPANQKSHTYSLNNSFLARIRSVAVEGTFNGKRSTSDKIEPKIITTPKPTTTTTTTTTTDTTTTSTTATTTTPTTITSTSTSTQNPSTKPTEATEATGTREPTPNPEGNLNISYLIYFLLFQLICSLLVRITKLECNY